MFYDYRDIFESEFFQKHEDQAEQLAMQVLIFVLKGDQNYHYENVAFLCDKKVKIENAENFYSVSLPIIKNINPYENTDS